MSLNYHCAMNVVSEEAVRRTDLKSGRQLKNDVHNVLKNSTLHAWEAAAVAIRHTDGSWLAHR